MDVEKVALQKLKVMSNMPEKSREEMPNGVVRVSFQETPPLPTYLACWALGKHERIEKTSEGGVKVGVYTPEGKEHQGRLALDVAASSLDYYAEFFGVTYPLPKMDLLSVADFPIGAMENWGLLTFRESFILADDTSSANTKQDVALVVAHEVAHQV